MRVRKLFTKSAWTMVSLRQFQSTVVRTKNEFLYCCVWHLHLRSCRVWSWLDAGSRVWMERAVNTVHCFTWLAVLPHIETLWAEPWPPDSSSSFFVCFERTMRMLLQRGHYIHSTSHHHHHHHFVLIKVWTLFGIDLLCECHEYLHSINRNHQFHSTRNYVRYIF